MIKPFMGFVGKANGSFYLLVVSHLAWPVLMTRNTWRMRSSAGMDVSLKRESLYKGAKWLFANTSLGSAGLDMWIELNSYPPKAKRNTRVQKNFVPAINSWIKSAIIDFEISNFTLFTCWPKEDDMQTRRFAFAMYANCHFSCRFIASSLVVIARQLQKYLAVESLKWARSTRSTAAGKKISRHFEHIHHLQNGKFQESPSISKTFTKEVWLCMERWKYERCVLRQTLVTCAWNDEVHAPLRHLPVWNSTSLSFPTPHLPPGTKCSDAQICMDMDIPLFFGKGNFGWKKWWKSFVLTPFERTTTKKTRKWFKGSGNLGPIPYPQAFHLGDSTSSSKLLWHQTIQIISILEFRWIS